MKYYFPVHIDSGNRGCEGIAKGTAYILGEPAENLIGLCTDLSIDRKFQVDKFIKLEPPRKVTLCTRIINFFYVRFLRLLGRDEYDRSGYLYKYVYGSFIDQMTKEDVLVSTGGDMMCYKDNFVLYTVMRAKRRGCKTILWGCSMGPQNLTRRKEIALRNFDVIYARETLSRDFFLSLGLKNVVCLPDPAFALEPIPTELPSCFSSNKVIGVNLSNLTVGAFNLNTPFGKEVRELFDYIIAKTDYHILLIPHVMWSGQDDRRLAKVIEEEYYSKAKGRISILNTEDLSYLEIRYIISNCHIFIGGRTHAVISAYSTCTPAIALGYSIKSKGIAHDLGLGEELIVDTKQSSFNGELLKSFLYADKSSNVIRIQLENIIPRYKEKVKNIKIR